MQLQLGGDQTEFISLARWIHMNRLDALYLKHLKWILSVRQQTANTANRDGQVHTKEKIQ